MGGRVLRAVDVGRGQHGAMVDAVRAALDGSGPAVLPVPADVPAPVRSVLVAALRPDDGSAPLERDDVAMVVPTSGSTGEPKGALLTVTAVLASARATAARLSGPGDWVLALPLTHVAGLMVVARAHAAGQAPTVMVAAASDSARGFDPAVFAAATAEALHAQGSGVRPLYTSLVPTQLERLLDAGADLRAYAAILLGAAAASAELLERAQDAGARVVTTYGMTETCGGCVYGARPLEGVGVRVEEIGDGGSDVGRVVLDGPTLFAGYRLRPDLTEAAFDDRGGFRTGDLGRWDGDRLEVLGRLDDVIVTGGEKVVPGMVEAALAQVSGPGVRWCVVGVADSEWGQRVVAVVVAPMPDPASAPAPDGVDDLPTLRDRVRDLLPPAWLPREVVRVPALPMLATGKVDRVAVAGLASDPLVVPR